MPSRKKNIEPSFGIINSSTDVGASSTAKPLYSHALIKILCSGMLFVVMLL